MSGHVVNAREASYNAPRLHVAIEARKIVISGEVGWTSNPVGDASVPRAGSTPVIFRQNFTFLRKCCLSCQLFI